MKLVAALLAIVGVVALLLFGLTGAGGPPAAPTALSAPLGPMAGSPLLLGGGALLFVVGTAILGRGEERYALTEVLLVLAAGAAGGLTAALVIGVARRWSPETLGALTIGALAEGLVALGFAIRVATQPVKRKLLFVPGLLATALVGLVQLLLATLGAG